MIDLLLSHEDHHARMRDCISAGPRATLITTYGVWAGINHDGKDYTELGPAYLSPVRQTVDLIDRLPNVRIVVGLYPYGSCRGLLPCRDCEGRYTKSLLRLLAHAEHFRNIKWLVVDKLHLKCALFVYEKGMRCLVGGRNLTGSDWADVTVELSGGDVPNIAQHVLLIAREARLLTLDEILLLLRAAGISNEGLARVVE